MWVKKFSICTIITLSLISLNIQAQAYDAEMYYNLTQKGVYEFKNNNFTKAIEDFETAIKINPDDLSVRNNLAASYIAKGYEIFTNKSDLTEAANNHRVALYYLKYDNREQTSEIIQKSIEIAERNLDGILNSSRADLTASGHLKMAKDLRGKGRFREAVVEYDKASTNDKFKPESYEALGDLMKVLKNDEKSVEYYQNALSINKNNNDLRLKLARSLDKIGKEDEAVKEYDMVLSKSNDDEVLSAVESIWRNKVNQNPQDALAHLNLGVVLQKKKDYENALAQYKAAVMLDPLNVLARVNIASLLVQNKDYEGAIGLYNQILEVDPQNISVRFDKVRALSMSGNKAETMKELQAILAINPSDTSAKIELFNVVRSLDSKEDCLTIFETFATNNPNDFQSQYNYAYELHKDKKYDLALQYYEKALSLNSQNEDARLNVGAIYVSQGNYPKAKENLDIVLKTNPKNEKAKELLVEIDYNSVTKKYEVAAKKYDEGNYKGALEEYSLLENKTPEVYIGMGACHQKLNETTKALECYQKAIALDKNNFTAYYYTGIIYDDKNNYDKAREYYNKALALKPENKEVKDSILYVNRTQAEELVKSSLTDYSGKKYNAALIKLNKAISLDNKNANAYYYRAMNNEACSKKESAIADYKKAVTLAPELTISYYAIALNYDFMKKYKEASEAYQKFVSVHNKDDEYKKYSQTRIKELKGKK